MDYCTQQDLETRFGAQEILELSDRDGDGLADTGVVERAIAEAAARIDSYVGQVHDLPLSEVPAALTSYACDIARFLLFGARAPEEVRRRYDDAIEWLRLLAAGRVSLGLDTPPPVVSSGVTVLPGASAYDWDTY